MNEEKNNNEEEFLSNLISSNDDKSLKQKVIELKNEVELIENERNKQQNQLDQL